MGFWVKRQNVKFVRDEETGETKIIRTGDRMGESRTPISDKLLAQQKPQQAQQKKPSRLVAFGKKVDVAIVNYNRKRNPLGPGGRGRPGPRNANPFGTVFDTGMDYPKQKHSKSKTQYVVIKGVAYPKAKSKKKGGRKGKVKGNRSRCFNAVFCSYPFSPTVNISE